MTNWRKFYVPGIISLIGLPVLVLFFLPAPKPKPQLAATRLFLPYEGKEIIRASGKLSKAGFLNSIKGKKIISIDLGSEYYEEENYLKQAKMRLVKSEIERLSFTGDSTSTVLLVQFDDSLTYGQFVWLMNQTLIYNIRKWTFFDHSFYFVFPPRLIPKLEDIIIN